MKRENHFMKQNNQSYIGYIAFVVGGYIAIFVLINNRHVSQKSIPNNVLFCFVYFVLFCFVLLSSALFCFVLFCFVLFCASFNPGQA